jgi:hypothetical protein
LTLLSSTIFSPWPIVAQGFVLGKAIDAAIQAQVAALRKLPRQFVLAVGIQQVELFFQRVGAIEALRAHRDVALPGRGCPLRAAVRRGGAGKGRSVTRPSP